MHGETTPRITDMRRFRQLVIDHMRRDFGVESMQWARSSQHGFPVFRAGSRDVCGIGADQNAKSGEEEPRTGTIRQGDGAAARWRSVLPRVQISFKGARPSCAALPAGKGCRRARNHCGR